MSKKEILNALEAIAQKLSIKVVYDDVSGNGGICRCKDRYYLIINHRLPLERKIDILLDGVSNFDLDEVDSTPEIRTLLERKVFNKHKLTKEFSPTG